VTPPHVFELIIEAKIAIKQTEIIEFLYIAIHLPYFPQPPYIKSQVVLSGGGVPDLQARALAAGEGI
jgi:hypothetical protein